MKRFLKFVAVLLVISMSVGILQPAGVKAASKVSINKTKATVAFGETVNLKITGTTDKVTWKSSDSKIAKVSSSGQVTGKNEGKATITATVTKKKYTCVITVVAKDGNFVIKKGVLTKYKGESESITIPDTVTSIGANAFKNCNSLVNVTIPNSVTSIGAHAFANCENLTNITIPDSVKSISQGAFDNTNWLSLQRSKNPLVIVNGILVDGITCEGTVTIPNTVTSIGPGAFSNYKKTDAECTATKIVLPNSVTSIGARAFYGFSSLKSIVIPPSVKSIGGKAFSGCKDLTIIGAEGSYAQSYAKKQGIKFEIDNSLSQTDDKKSEENKQQDTPIYSGGGSSGGGVSSCNVSFYDGDRLIETVLATRGEALGYVPSVEKTSKDNYIFVGWYTDKEFTQPFYADSPITESMAVYGKYTEMPGETLNITSFTQLDQSPDLSFEVVRAANGTISPEEAFTLASKDGTGLVPLKWVQDGDIYTVFADGGFNEGSSYELTLADGYTFKDKLDTIRTVSFTIAMAEVDNLKMSNEIVYIQDTAAMQYTIPGQSSPVDVLTPSLVPESGGVFTYDGAGSLEVGDILCFYTTTNPQDRDYINNNYINDPEVYVEVENISGNTVTFGALEDEDMEALYNVPDNFPILVNELPTGETGTVNINDLDAETYASIIGEAVDTIDKVTAKVSIGDFVSLYTSAYKTAYSAGESESSENAVYYGEVTAYDSTTGVITYKRTTAEAIEDSMNLYITPEVSGDDILTSEEKAEIEGLILEQVKDSSFAEDAAYLLADLATKTDGFRNTKGVKELLLKDENGSALSEDEIALLNLGASFELADDVDLTVEIITKGDQLHFNEGVQLAIGIDATFEVDTADEGKVAIDLSATFVEEVALGINVKGELVKKKILGIPIPIGVSVSSAVDVKNYTAVNFNINVYTVAPEEKSTWDKLKELMNDTKVGEVLDKIEELQSKIDQGKEDVETLRGYMQDVDDMWKSITTEESNPKAWMETLGKTNITKDLMDMLNLSTETNIASGKYADSLNDLMQKYSEMLQKETDWVELINQEMFEIEYCLYGLAIAASANFIVRTDLNIAMGSSLEYEVGKRYTFWFKVGLFSPTAGSSTMDLIDERFAFQFYVMGKAGLKMGVKAKIAVGIGSTKLASVGITAELGPYIKLYGFFIYEYEKMRPANSNNWNYSQRKAGALYVDFGVYFILGFEANAISIFEYSKDLINQEVSLLTAGERKYHYGFDYEPQQGEQVRIVDENSDSRDGITMKLPDSFRAVSYVELDTGLLGSEYYDYSKYNITLSNPYFTIDNNGVISVNVPDGVQYMECDLTITWLYNKLAFSNYDMSVTIPLVWTNLTSKELKEYFTASVRVGNNIDGYQTIWSQRVRKNQLFSLPTDDDIKKLIGYDNYDNGSGTNLKYSSLSGYKTNATKDLTIYTDTVYDFDVTYRDYTITVNGIQNADGTRMSKVYTTRYGMTFDFSDLKETGTAVANTEYTKFFDVTTEATIPVTNKDGMVVNQVIDLTQPVTGKAALALVDGNKTATANYVDDSVVATFQFVGIDHEVITQKLKKNSKPDLSMIEPIAEAADMMIKEITPAIGKMQASTNYIVYLSAATGPKTTISFEENGGSEVPDITKIAGSIIGVLPEPTKAGYSFAGWFTDNKFTEMFTLERMPETNITLYAKWIANTYTVTLNANGGSFDGDINTTTVTVIYGESYGDLPKPKKTGESFAGWYTAPEGGELASIVTIAGNHTLYARWSLLDTIDATNMKLDGITAIVYDGTPKVATVVTGSALIVSGGAIDASMGIPVTPSAFTIQYRRADADEWSDTAINAGLYSIKVSIDTSVYTNIAPFEKIFRDAMEIGKAQSYFMLQTPNQLTGTLFGKGNIVVQKLVPGVDYIGDGKVEYAVVRSGSNVNLPWKWQTSNAFVNVGNNATKDGDYMLTARICEGENYLGSELSVCEKKLIDFILTKYYVWVPTVDTIHIPAGENHLLNETNGYTYRVKIKTGDVNYAGTDSKIYAGISYGVNPVSNADNIEYFRLDAAGDNFERNMLDEFTLKMADSTDPALNPLYFELHFIRKGTNPGWYCAWVEVEQYKDGQLIGTSGKLNVERWFENNGDYFATEIRFKRTITKVEGFDHTSESLVLSAADHNETYDFIFNGTVYDQYIPEGYNPYDYTFSPELNITAEGYEDCIDRTVNSISIDRKKLYNMMVANNCDRLEFTITLDFDKNDTNVLSTFNSLSKKIIITRQ